MDEKYYLKAIRDFVYNAYATIFGEKFSTGEPFNIINCPDADCPMLITNQNPITIRLAQSSLSYWSQTIFQLSHELCHYAMRQFKIDKSFTLSWFEEIVCEAMSLYALEYSHKHWDICALSKINSTFSESIKTYLYEQLNKPYNSNFADCTTITELYNYESRRQAENDRCSQIRERNAVYEIISQDVNSVRILCEYQNYLMDNQLVIDFERWLADSPCELLKKMKIIQPIIKIL